MTQLSLSVSFSAGPVQSHAGKRDSKDGRPIDPVVSPPVIVSVSLSSGASVIGETVTMIVACDGAPTPRLEYRWRVDGELTPGAEAANWAITRPGLLVGETRALNSAGETAWVASPPLVVTATTPQQMGAPTVTGGAERATLVFAEAPADGGSAIDFFGYEVASVGDALFAAPVAQGAQAGRIPDVAISPLAIGDYIARTRARNAIGWGAWSPSGGVASVSPAASVPAAMAPPSVKALSGTVLCVTRASAPPDGGSAITSFDLRYSADGSSWTVVTDLAAVHDLTGLPNGSMRLVQTGAVNAVGWGAWSSSVAATTWTAPVVLSVELSPAAPVVGQAVAAIVSVSGDPAPTLAYRWLLDGVLIPGAEAASYVTAAAGVLLCEVRAANAIDQTLWIASDAALVQAPVAPPEPLAAHEATLTDSRTPSSGLYLWTTAQALDEIVEADGPAAADWRPVPASWSFHAAATDASATMNLRRRNAQGLTSAIVARSATPSLGSANAYSVFRDTPLTRPAQGVTWAAALLTAANVQNGAQHELLLTGRGVY